jgi:uncharacterized integral membrane protein
VWFAVAVFAVILVPLVFILRNSRKVQISYRGARGRPEVFYQFRELMGW